MAQVKFKRIEDSSDINDIPIVDGQLIYTKDGKQYIDYETDRVNLYGENGSVLWTNSAPSSEFAEQNITLSNSNYDIIVWTFKVDTSDYSSWNTTTITIKGYGSITQFDSGMQPYTRKIEYVNDTTYKIGNCYSNPSSTSAVNTILIPLKAVGINLSLGE